MVQWFHTRGQGHCYWGSVVLGIPRRCWHSSGIKPGWRACIDYCTTSQSCFLSSRTGCWVVLGSRNKEERNRVNSLHSLSEPASAAFRKDEGMGMVSGMLAEDHHSGYKGLSWKPSMTSSRVGPACQPRRTKPLGHQKAESNLALCIWLTEKKQFAVSADVSFCYFLASKLENTGFIMAKKKERYENIIKT